MVSVFRSDSNDEINIVQSFNYRLTEHIDKKIVDEVIQKMSDRWVEAYGEKLLNELAPEAVAGLIKKRISQEITNRIIGDK